MSVHLEVSHGRSLSNWAASWNMARMLVTLPTFQALTLPLNARALAKAKSIRVTDDVSQPLRSPPSKARALSKMCLTLVTDPTSQALRSPLKAPAPAKADEKSRMADVSQSS